MRMSIKKYAVLVDKPGGPLSVLVDDLKRLEFRVALVPECRAARSFMRHFSKLGLIVINGMGRDVPKAFVSEAQVLHPNLPIVFLDDSACTIQTAKEVSRIEGPIDADKLAQLVSAALLEHCYPQHVLANLSFAVEEAMAGFDNHAVTDRTYLRATNGAIGELTALLPFSGSKVSGYLAVGCSRETATRLYSGAFPKDTDVREDQLMDLLGEICNRAIGRFHQVFESRGLSFNFGVSLYLTNSSQLRVAQEHPAIVLELEAPAGTVFIELFLDGLIPTPTLEGLTDDPRPAGEFVLL
jgi:hypothetical protein